MQPTRHAFYFSTLSFSSSVTLFRWTCSRMLTGRDGNWNVKSFCWNVHRQVRTTLLLYAKKYLCVCITAFRVPLPPSGPLAPKQLSARDLVDFVSANSGSKRESVKRKRRVSAETSGTQPSLSVLSTQEIQSDLQLLTAPRPRGYHMQTELNASMNIAPPFDPHYPEYNTPGINGHPQSHAAYGHALPPAPPVGIHHPYQPTPSGRAYQHQQQPGPPMGSIFHPQARMQGPGAPPPGSYLLGAAVDLIGRPLRQ